MSQHHVMPKVRMSSTCQLPVESSAETSDTKMNSAVVADEMFPEGVGTYMEIEEVN